MELQRPVLLGVPDMRKRLLIPLLLLSAVVLSGCGTDRFTNSGGWAGPVATEDLVFVGSRDGRVLALDANTGDLKWSYPHQEDDPLGSIYGTPFLTEDSVYVGTFEGKLYSLSSADLSRRWEFPVDDRQLGHIIGGPTVADGLVIYGTSEGTVTALDVFSQGPGVPEWTFQTDNQVWSSPTVVDGTVYVTSLDHRVYALSLRDGSTKWRTPFEAGGAIVSSPLVADGTLFVGSFDSTFYALDATGGGEIWRFDGEGWFWPKPVTNGRLVYAGTTSGKLYALDMNSGFLIWEHDMGSPIISAPVLIDERLAVTSDEGVVQMLDADDGALLGSFPSIKTQVRAALGTRDNTLYVNDMDGKVWALELDSRGRGFDRVWPQPYDTRGNN